MPLPPETLASYVPTLVARRFASNPAPLTAPSADRFSAAVIFADISGYSTMAARLAQQGPAGAEELIRLLNAYFGKLIDVVLAHGGDIIKFAGDAALVLWPATDESLQVATHRTTQCGLEMQQVLGQYEVAEGLRLSLRVGIGAGDVLTASVGGVFGRWELLVAGMPLMQMGAAQRQAQPGQVILSPEAWSLVQDQCRGLPLSDLPDFSYVLVEACNPLLPRRLPRIELAVGAEAALRGYIPGAILARLSAGQTEWISELRRITVVFLNVLGMDYQSPDALDRMQTVMHSMQTALYHYEGSVNQFIVDDKGTTLVAAFGLPPVTHEDDATRGAQAALSMQAKLQELGLDCSIGVTTAQAYCGERGNALRREYAMVGDVVNMSARLMQAAARYRGSSAPILCDEVTYHAAQNRLTFDVLTPINVKGRTEPMPVFRPSGQVGRDARGQMPSRQRAALIGRGPERAMLTENLRRLLRGEQGGVVVIEGEAGIGKSRLVGELLQQGRALNVRCLVGEGDAIEKSAPYHAWRGIFGQLLGLRPELAPEERREQVLAQLQSSPGLLRLAPLLNALLPLDWAENDATRQMDAQVRADNIRTLLISLLQTAARQSPLVVVLENALWMDSASWILALAAGQQVHSILLVIVTRPLTGSLPEEYRQMLLLTSAMQWLRLEPLSSDEMMALVCQRLNVSNLPDAVAALIHEKAQGNPFFGEELAYTLRDTGLVVIADGQCQVAPGAGDFGALSLPDTVQGVINSRIDRLTPPQQLALKVASVIGPAFSLRILQDIYPIEADKAKLAETLDLLQQLDLTPRDASSQEPTFAFKNVAIQEAAYNLMLFAQRRQLHRAVAEWHERTFADDLSSLYTLLAHHWGKTIEGQHGDAALVAKAIEYLEKAGEQALRNYANQEAVRFLGEAVELDKQADQAAARLRRARWQRQLGEAFLSMGRLAESREHLERAVALLGWPVPVGRSQLVTGLARQLAIQAAHRLWPSRFTRLSRAAGVGPVHSEAASAPEPSAELVEGARAYWALGQVYFYANDKLLNIGANICSLNLAEKIGPSPELARSYASVCITAGLVQAHGLAEAYGQWARETAEATEHLPSLGWVMLVTAVYDAGVGNWERARAAVGKAVEISNRSGDRRRWEQSLNTLATVACLQGEFASIADLFDDLYESARRRGDAQYQVYGLLGHARCLLPLDRVNEAAALLEKAQALLERNLGRVEEIYAYGTLALARLRQGQPQLAREAADKAAQLIAQSRPISYNLVYAYAGVTEVYLSLWESGPILMSNFQRTALGTQALDSESRLSGFVSETLSLKSSALQACKALREFAQVFPIGRPSAWICQGVYDWLAGEKAQALGNWRRGLQAAERLAMPYEQGLAHFEIGRHTTGDERQRHLARARALFTQIGAAFDLARVQTDLLAR